MDSNFLHLDDLPDAEKDPQFWKVMQDPKLTSSIIYLIINEIRKYNPEKLNAQQCRTQLSKLKALQELLDFPKAILNAGEKETEYSDEIPE